MATSREIDAAAAMWVAQLDRGPLSTEDAAGLELWLDEEPRHRGAFMRMRAIALHSERARALSDDFDPASYRPADADTRDRDDADMPAGRTGVSRRYALRFAAAAAAVMTGIVGYRLIDEGKRLETRRGEQRVFALEDGSVVTLNTQSTALARFDERRRLVSLAAGEALFDVASNAARPFIVDAGSAQVRAVGTSFSVSRLEATGVEILVREGVVEVSGAGLAGPVRLVANQRLAIGRAVSARPQTIAADVVARELSWKTGLISLEGATLDQAVKAFARYSDARIVIEQPSVGRQEITGVFVANDPVAFAQAAALSLDLDVKVEDDRISLSQATR